MSQKEQEIITHTPAHHAHYHDTHARLLAAHIFNTIKEKKCRYEEAVFAHKERYNHLSSRDAALVKAIVMTTCRHNGVLSEAIRKNLKRPLHTKHKLLDALLMTGAAQIFFLSLPDYAVVHTLVNCAKKNKRLQPFSSLMNAVLRALTRQRTFWQETYNPLNNIPIWLKKRWENRYGSEATQAMASLFSQEPYLDITVASHEDLWEKRLDAYRLPTGSLRLKTRTPIAQLPGYLEGGWWVQDSASALPAKLLALSPHHTVIDLCAAPGGKTAQLAQSGAHVIACDRSETRLKRLHENIKRLKLENVTVMCGDARTLDLPQADAVLLDAPCLATGTFRHHPDGLLIKEKAHLHALQELQANLLDKAASLLRPKGHLIYATCSLEPEEGEEQIDAFLKRWPNFQRCPISMEKLLQYPNDGMFHVESALCSPQGDLRILPTYLSSTDPSCSGWDGFFAAHMIRMDGCTS